MGRKQTNWFAENFVFHMHYDTIVGFFSSWSYRIRDNSNIKKKNFEASRLNGTKIPACPHRPLAAFVFDRSPEEGVPVRGIILF
jgi:hypothetical protein